MSGNKCDSVIGAKCLIVQRKCSFSKLHLNGSADKQLFGLCGTFFYLVALPLQILRGVFSSISLPWAGCPRQDLGEDGTDNYKGLIGAGGWKAEQEMLYMPSCCMASKCSEDRFLWHSAPRRTEPWGAGFWWRCP